MQERTYFLVLYCGIISFASFAGCKSPSPPPIPGEVKSIEITYVRLDVPWNQDLQGLSGKGLHEIKLSYVISDGPDLTTLTKIIQNATPKWQSLGDAAIATVIESDLTVTYDDGRSIPMSVGYQTLLLGNGVVKLSPDQHGFFKALARKAAQSKAS